MAEDTYWSITTISQGIYKEKGSKFLAFAYPVSSEDDIKQHLAALRKEYFDARHHCYAYRLGAKGENFRANDDGEPNHSAGDPILGQLKSQNLSDVLVVVVRYFGGTKLGVGGLINAYKTATAEALALTQPIQKIVKVSMNIDFPYEQMNEVMKIIKDLEMEIKSQNFDNQCNMELRVRFANKDMALARFYKVDNLACTLQES